MCRCARNFIYHLNYNQVGELDVEEFRHIVGDRMIMDEDDLIGYNTDWLHIVR